MNLPEMKRLQTRSNNSCGSVLRLNSPKSGRFTPDRLTLANLIGHLTLVMLVCARVQVSGAYYYQNYQNGFNTQTNSLKMQADLQPQANQNQEMPQGTEQFVTSQLSASLQQPAQSQQQQPPQQQQQQQSPSHTSRSAIDSPIFRFNGQSLNSTTVKLVWNLLKNHHVDYFDIEWGPLPDAPNAFSIEKLNGTARDHVIHQLQPDTQYQFQLQVHGDHLHRPQLVAIRTPPVGQVIRAQDFIMQNNKDIMPLGVKAEAKSNNSIQLSWMEPERPPGIRNSSRVNIIRYYVVPSSTQAPMASQPAGSNETTPTASQPPYHYLNVTNARESRLIVQRLKPATEYAFAVKTAYYTPDLRRSLTQSGFSMDTSAKTFDLEPSPPKNFTIQPLPQTRDELLAGKSARLELSWLPPDSPNGQLRGYNILWDNEPNAPEDHWQRIEIANGSINNWYVENLLHGYNYYFKIRAINQRGSSGDSETRLYVAPMPNSAPHDKVNMPIPANNVFLMIIICMLLILFLLALVYTRLACGSRRSKARKSSLNGGDKKPMANGGLSATQMNPSMPKLNGFGVSQQLNSSSGGPSSTVAARVGTLARRSQVNGQSKPDFWISAMDQQPEIKSNISEKSNSDLNMAMVSIQRNSPQFATTQLAPALPEYRFAGSDQQQQQLIQQLQHQQNADNRSHYHPGQFTGALAYDQMDNATASALMTLSKRQQLQMQKYQIQFASTGGVPVISQAGNLPTQAPSPHQQPPPPPPLNIDQQQHQPLYGTHQTLANTRSLRLHRPTLYDPVSGSFVQGGANAAATGAAELQGPPNYNQSHNYNTGHVLGSSTLSSMGAQFCNNSNSNTLQYYPHQTSTLLSRRSTNTLRSFQAANSTYGQLPGANTFTQVTSIGANNQSQQQQHQPQQLLQSHQAVINQLNGTNPANNFPSLPLKHVSAVRPQIMSSLEDQIELELAEKEQQQPPTQQQATS